MTMMVPAPTASILLMQKSLYYGTLESSQETKLMAKTKKNYDSLMESAVEKFSEEDADYRDGEGSLHSHGPRHHRCGNCVHFLVRKVDQFGICEVVRPPDDEPIDEDYVCSFWTRDGEKFPLLK
jgi:hypothetical protein